MNSYVLDANTVELLKNLDKNGFIPDHNLNRELCYVECDNVVNFARGFAEYTNFKGIASVYCKNLIGKTFDEFLSNVQLYKEKICIDQFSVKYKVCKSKLSLKELVDLRKYYNYLIDRLENSNE